MRGPGIEGDALTVFISIETEVAVGAALSKGKDGEITSSFREFPQLYP